MKKEDKYTPKKQCKKFLDLGIVLDTEYYWDVTPYNERGLVSHPRVEERLKLWIENGWFLPAPDVAELGLIFKNLHLDTPYFDFGEKIWTLPNWFWGINEDLPEADIRASTLIWFLGNDVIKPEDVKL